MKNKVLEKTNSDALDMIYSIFSNEIRSQIDNRILSDIKRMNMNVYRIKKINRIFKSSH